MKNHSLESIYRINNDSEGVCIEVRDDGDIEEMILIRTPDEGSSEWFGYVRFSLDIEQARLMAQALDKKIRDIEMQRPPQIIR